MSDKLTFKRAGSVRTWFYGFWRFALSRIGLAYRLRSLFIQPAPTGQRCVMGGPVHPAVWCPRYAIGNTLWCPEHTPEREAS